MKKITSIFSLALFSALTLSLSSCNDCEGGESGWNPGAQGVTIEQLEKKLADAAQQLVALSSDGKYVLSYDPTTGKWYYAVPGLDGKLEIKEAPGGAGKDGLTPTIGGNGNWWIGTTDTGVPATGPSGVTPKMQINGTTGNWEVSYDNGATWKDTGVKAQGPAGADGMSGIKDVNGIYVKTKENDSIYIPKISGVGETATAITVGGTTYKIPKACECSITNDGNGTYYIKAGATEDSIKVPVVPDWVGAVTIEYNGNNFEVYDKAEPAHKITIPNGYADLTIDSKGVATVTSANKKDSIKLQKTQPVVISATDDSGAAWVINYGLDGKAIDTLKLPQFGQFTALTTKVGQIETNLKSLGTWNPEEHNGKTMAETVDSIGNEVSALEKKVSSMFETLMQKIAESITNIQVEEVVSNAIGSYNGIFTNLKTTKLVGYIGTFQKLVRFPSDVADYIKIPAGTVYTDTLGEIQLTVNPISKDFSNLSVSLVNSLGEESSIKLSNLKGSDKLLKTGFTRADGTGLYTTSAIVDKVDIVSDPKLHMTIDKSAVKTAISDLINDMKKSDWKNANVNVQPSTLNKILNAINSAVEGVSTERLAVKTEWEQTVTDPVTGKDVTTKKSVVSPYDLSGIAFKPLSFEAYPKDTLVEKFQRLDNRAKNFIKRMNDKLANRVKKTIDEKFGLDKIESQIGELQIKLDKIDTVSTNLTTDITMHLKIKTNVPIQFTQKMQVGYEILVPTDLFNTTGWEDDIKGQGAELDREKSKVLSSDPTYTMAYIKQNVSFDVDENPEVNIDQDVTAKDVTIDVSDLVEPVNNAVDAIKSINALCESVNNIIDQVRNIENKIEKGTYLNRIYKYLDKASAYAAKGIYKLFQPVLLVNSDKGFSFAGIRGVAAKASGKVEVIPTTFSNGLVAPIYKKYISVNGGKGKVLDGSQISLDITSELKKGYNKVEFYAIDYHGIEKHYTYSIFKE